MDNISCLYKYVVLLTRSRTKKSPKMGESKKRSSKRFKLCQNFNILRLSWDQIWGMQYTSNVVILCPFPKILFLLCPVQCFNPVHFHILWHLAIKYRNMERKLSIIIPFPVLLCNAFPTTSVVLFRLFSVWYLPGNGSKNTE